MTPLSEALQTLNGLNIALDAGRCFTQGRHSICLSIEDGVQITRLDGRRVEWIQIAPLLKPRRRPKPKPLPEPPGLFRR